MGTLGKKCVAHPKLGARCPSGPNLIKKCPHCDPMRWGCVTVAFSKFPKGISFACSGCSAPGLATQFYITNSTTCDDLDKMMCGFVNAFEICADTFLFPIHLAETGGWVVLYEDSDTIVHGAIKKGTSSTFPDMHEFFPYTPPDPGPPRCKDFVPPCAACDSVTIDLDTYTGQVSCGL